MAPQKFPFEDEGQMLEDKRRRKHELRLSKQLQKAREAHDKAVKSLQRAEVRLQKRVKRLQKLEAGVTAARQEAENIPVVETHFQETTPVAVDPSVLSHVNRVRAARAVAEAAEESARAASKRASEIARGGGQTAINVALAEEISPSATQAHQVPAQVIDSAKTSRTEERRLDASIAADLSEEINREEENVEAVAAMIIADAAGVAAAEAEAIAEACGARVREARTRAQEADDALNSVRVSLVDGRLADEQAQTALVAAEREASLAHAALVEAEAAEKQALQAAMDAQAEAEVAEGMAFATRERREDDQALHSNHATPGLGPSSRNGGSLEDESGNGDVVK